MLVKIQYWVIASYSSLEIRGRNDPDEQVGPRSTQFSILCLSMQSEGTKVVVPAACMQINLNQLQERNTFTTQPPQPFENFIRVS